MAVSLGLEFIQRLVLEYSPPLSTRQGIRRLGLLPFSKIGILIGGGNGIGGTTIVGSHGRVGFESGDQHEEEEREGRACSSV